MKLWKITPMLVLAGALIAPAVHAAEPGDGPVIVNDRMPQTQGDTARPQGQVGGPTQPGGAAPGQPGGAGPGQPGGAMNGPETPGGRSVEGRVAAVDHESGRFVLDTSEGPISLLTTPDELEGVQIGDLVRVSLVRNDHR